MEIISQTESECLCSLVTQPGIFSFAWTKPSLFHIIFPLTFTESQKQKDKAWSKVKVKRQRKGGEEMSTLSPESSFNLSRAPIFRWDVVFKPLYDSRTGGCLWQREPQKWEWKGLSALKPPRAGFLPARQSLYLCWSLSLFPLCSTEFTVKTQEAEWFPLRKVPDEEVKEQNHQALWAHPCPCTDGFRQVLPW